MMKKLLYIGFALLLGALSSCSDDFLTETNPNTPTVEQFWKTREDAISAINSTYTNLTFQYVYGFFEYGWGPENWRSDDVTYNASYETFVQIANFQNTTDCYEPSRLYKNYYNIVNAANQCIDNLHKCDLTEDELAQLVAEAKYMRAYAYFGLLRNFRNIPFYTKSPENKDEIYASQAERSEVWALIESDLLEAINTLPKERESTEVGRADKGAAAGYLSWAYMYQQKYTEAQTLLNRIINGEFKAYDLLSGDNYSQNWDGQNEHNQESLFEVNMDDLSEWVAINVLLPEFTWWGEANASNWIFGEFTSETDVDGDTDVRYYKSMISPNLTFDNNIFPPDWFENSNCIILKHCGDSYSDWYWINNYPLLRFADILLLQAEATNEVSGADAALPFINRVRQRANMANLPAGQTKEQMRSKIMHERAVELCFESRRWYDLVRWHEAGFINMKDVLTASGKQGVANFTDKNMYYPIPEREYETNPNLDRAKQW